MKWAHVLLGLESDVVVYYVKGSRGCPSRILGQLMARPLDFAF